MREPLGDFIGGRFHEPRGAAFQSENPVDGTVVLESSWDPSRIDEACGAASAALTQWRAKSLDDRYQALLAFRDALSERKDALAEALVLEVGKIASEAQQEVASVLGRFELVERRVREDLAEGPLPGFPSEALRHHGHGVVGIIGPFNFPLHLCHAYVVPALLLGNTVVVKPSEAALLGAQRYAEAAKAAGLPPGVLNIVAGRGAAGAQLLRHPELRGLCFTGSWDVGRRILAAMVDRPEVLVALEMGGKNAAVVFDDADLRQAAHEIIVGGYLTTGQRCTCTDRVLVQRSVKDELCAMLSTLVSKLRMGDPRDPQSFAGPLATRGGLEKFRAAVAAAERAGATCLATGTAPEGGCFAAPTLHDLGTRHVVPGYTDVELFGPDVHVEGVEDEDEACERLQGGLSGFVHSVFTSSQGRFDELYRRLSCGMLNHNRSTNRASPRLPFGGVGKSGNFRPAGSYAPRALSFPVAVLQNPVGVMELHPLLAEALPPPDLEALATRHAREEFVERSRDLLSSPRPNRMCLPRGGQLPASSDLLARLYGDGRMAKEKKPGVFDHLRSWGPWFTSVDVNPLCVLDGMSQTATVPAGFSPDEVVRAYVEGEFGASLEAAEDTSAVATPQAEAFAEALRALVPGLPHVSFVNSGAESCEKALALCRLEAKSPAQKKVLAFEGGFHGRTLLSLFASYNPSKRVPFEIEGYGVTFAPFPVWWEPHHGEPTVPAGWLAAAANADHAALRAAAEVAAKKGDPTIEAEVVALTSVGEALAGGEHFAVIVEAMQSEGGDRYATARFFKALRLLTRHFDVPLVIDEVQTGFGLGGTFAWHTRLGLVDKDGKPDVPDCVTFAKRAQVGVVMSRFEDPEPTSAHPASLVRGRLHAGLMADDPRASEMEQIVRDKLADLARRHPELVKHPRATGYAFAYDLPSADHLARYVPQRFWRGNIVFAAGSQTVRHRLSPAFDEGHLEQLFTSMHRSLSWLEANPGIMPPEWLDLPEATRDEAQAVEVRTRRAEPREAAEVLRSVQALEAKLFEPARRDTEEWLRRGFDDPDGVVVVAEVRDGAGWRFAGSAIGAPLERVSEAEGPDRDPMLGQRSCFYSISVTVDPELQGAGIGRLLKQRQLQEAAAMRGPDGAPRYRHASGRVRVGKTDAMSALNRSFGAYTVFRLDNQYGEPGAQAIYYRLPLGPFVVDARAGDVAPAGERIHDLRQGLSKPFAEPPVTLRELQEGGQLFGPAVNKITICNYVTPAIVRGVEWVASLVPSLPHLYLTSSRDEAFDKTVRTFRFQRKAAKVALGFEGGYVGHTTAAARSLSDPDVHAQGPAYFDTWARVPHPADVGVERTLAALSEAITEAGGPEQIIGMFFEPLQERTGRVVPDAFWPALDELRRRLDVPVALSETATACYRSGRGPFFSSSLSFVPDAMFWWGGGQVGFVHVGKRYFLWTPLMMVSTWDGDELSLVRVHHQLRAARSVDVQTLGAELVHALAPAASAGLPVRGCGLYRVLEAGARADELRAALSSRGVELRPFPKGRLALVPPLDAAPEASTALRVALEEILG